MHHTAWTTMSLVSQIRRPCQARSISRLRLHAETCLTYKTSYVESYVRIDMYIVTLMHVDESY